MRDRPIAARFTDLALPIDPSVALRYRLIAQIAQTRATLLLLLLLLLLFYSP